MSYLRNLTRKKRDEDAEVEHSPSGTQRDAPLTSPISMDEKRPSSVSNDENGDEPSGLHPSKLIGGAIPKRINSRTPSFTSMMESTRRIPATAPLDATDIGTSCGPSTSAAIANAPTKTSSDPTPLLPTCAHSPQSYSFHQPQSPTASIHKVPLSRRILGIARDFVTPATCSVVVGIPMAVIQPLKALFTHTEGWSGTRMPNAPDGKAPLAFILDTTIFLGGMTVPAALVLLGASFARLKVGVRSKVR
jgi:hypothetical protein